MMNAKEEETDEQKQQNEKLLRLMTGYGQHANLSVNPPAQNGQLVKFMIHC